MPYALVWQYTYTPGESKVQMLRGEMCERDVKRARMWRWGGQLLLSLACLQPAVRGMRVDGSTACAASSMMTTSKARAMRAKAPLPLKLSVEQTMAASSSTAVRRRSFSARPAIRPPCGGQVECQMDAHCRANNWTDHPLLDKFKLNDCNPASMPLASCCTLACRA